MSKERKQLVFKAFKAAFPKTIPIFAGFWFIGMAYGVYMVVNGFTWVYPAVMSLVIFGGSLEFITVTMLMAPFAPVSAFLVALMVQARHIFYGISMLEKYKNMGWKKPYLIYALCDETFSINYTADIPEDVDKGWFYFFVTILNHFYWFSGSICGALIGGLITFNTTGLDFVMTAMFVVIFLEQLLKEKQPFSAIIGVVGSLICLIIFGADSFIIPAMVVIMVLVTLFKKPISKVGGF